MTGGARRHLRLVRGDDVGPGEIGLVGDPERAEERLRFLAAVLQMWRTQYSDVDVLETVVEGRPSGAPLKAASGAELLVVGHRLTAPGSCVPAR
ncbi:hypothetical protein [Streptomyces sp. NPDC048584]|uniref:hypothetical protein n=1 Tax=Streptomyces sp. NPDC048584 TaxID=3365573 RepID=UPI00371A3BF2